ncbi:hypothetical protein FAZ69_07555 [Trinickia terrae]|uniref:Uncharacterized protein n=1 Tax=Trinickia terrae TaxID=2571161 RepID=A0A4U1IC78_9BURK|nr:hypothetical protein [Trinickia terrae]TKC91204.1 hypothetical protein FAZ69_07555 [Trinickia terrae]
MLDAVEHGDLIFVPDHADLRACVKAIQENRKERPVPAPPLLQSDTPSPAQMLYGNAPHVLQNLDTPSYSPETGTPLGNAQPFEYQPDMPDGGAELLAGGDGMPGNNQAQNKQFRAVVKALGLNQDQARRLHYDIQGDNLDYRGILERALDMFGDQPQ